MKQQSEIELAEPNARVAFPDASLVPLVLLSKRLGRNHGSLLKRVDKHGWPIFYFRPRRDNPKLTKALKPSDAIELILGYVAEGFDLPSTDPKAVSQLWATLEGTTPESRELIESVVKEALARWKKNVNKTLAFRNT